MSEPVSRLQRELESGRFVVTGEIGPPKGTNVEPVLEEAEEYLKDTVTAVNVTDIQTAVMRMGSMAVSHMLIDRGVEPVFQMVTRDRNRLALQSDLLSAYALGIRNVLALTGDHVAMGDHPESKPVYDVDSVGLLQLIANLEAGRDWGHDFKGNPNELDGAPAFYKGCCVAPSQEELDMQVLKLEKKVEAGAQFVQTQAVYDEADFERFAKKTEHIDAPILAGIVMLKTAGMAKYMNSSVPGVIVPKPLIKRLSDCDKKDRKKVSIEICAELIAAFKPYCQGVHLMTLGWEKTVPKIVEAAGMA